MMSRFDERRKGLSESGTIAGPVLGISEKVDWERAKLYSRNVAEQAELSRIAMERYNAEKAEKNQSKDPVKSPTGQDGSNSKEQ